MLIRSIQKALALMLVATTLSGVGCIATSGPGLGLLSLPIPVSPYHQKLREDRFEIQERYARVPVMGPITNGGPAIALDPPSDHEVMAALERARPIQGGLPFLHEKQQNNVRIIKEKIADYIDPPRFVPLIGPAQLHHAHYKCTVYMDERTMVGWPFPHQLEDEVVEVLYIDHNHFHMVGNVTGGASAPF